MKLFDKLMEKKKKKGLLSPNEKKVKMDVVQSMKDSMQEMMGDRLGDVKKVTVASDSDEGLKEGLEKAEDVLEEKDGMEEESEGEDMEMASEESSEYEDMEDCKSPEEIDAKIQKLLAMKKKLKSQEQV